MGVSEEVVRKSTGESGSIFEDFGEFRELQKASGTFMKASGALYRALKAFQCISDTAGIS